MKLPEFALARATEAHDARFDGRFVVASHVTGVYHRPSCSAAALGGGDLVFFEHTAAADAAGFRLCAVCDPGAPAGQRLSGAAKPLVVSGSPSAPPESGGGVESTRTRTLRLPFRRPYSWTTVSRFLGQRAIPGVETVGPGVYRRTVKVAGQHGVVSVRPVADADHLAVRFAPASLAEEPGVAERLRGFFDLDASAGVISRHLSESPLLADAVARDPGLRLPGAWDPFELAVRAILGQQVSVAGARTLAGRVAAAFGEPLASDELSTIGGIGDCEANRGWCDGSPATSGLFVVFPSPETLADADLSGIGLTGSRQVAIRSLARAVVADPSLLQRRASLAEAVEVLCRLPGVGDWTAHYIAMRAFGETDAFPASDLGLRHALATSDDPAPKPKRVLALAEEWRPWRAYALMHLWMALPSTER